MKKKKIPRERSIDSTIALLRDPYGFVRKRCQAHGADLFETRLRGRRVICMSGKEAARLFYDKERFTREGAAPPPLQKTLFGQGGVQGLDGHAHLRRKALFMKIMAPERVAELASLSSEAWDAAARKWETMEKVVLYDAAREVFTRSVCAWAGVPLHEAEAGRRVSQLTALFEYAGSVSVKHFWARRARKQAESWASRLIESVRSGALLPPSGSALLAIATYEEPDGRLLDPEIAAVELLNVLRPTVAVAVYIVFVALALHRHPQCKESFKKGDDEYAQAFVEEVRRVYPFFPAVIARTKREFEWQGYRFPGGRDVVLDLYGTNHDPREWDKPEEFIPERFLRKSVCPFSHIPQGGGDPHFNHRCPGEGAAVELMKTAANFLVNRIDYEVPEQDTAVDRAILPALPGSRFVISRVKTSR